MSFMTAAAAAAAAAASEITHCTASLHPHHSTTESRGTEPLHWLRVSVTDEDTVAAASHNSCFLAD